MKYKNILCFFILLFITINLFSQTRNYPGDPRMSSYDDWNATPWNSKVAYINGILIGTYYVAIAYAWENPGMGLPDIQHLVPAGIAADDAARLVDAVYHDPENRKLPIVYIVVNWKSYNSKYGGGI